SRRVPGRGAVARIFGATLIRGDHRWFGVLLRLARPAVPTISAEGESPVPAQLHFGASWNRRSDRSLAVGSKHVPLDTRAALRHGPRSESGCTVAMGNGRERRRAFRG